MNKTSLAALALLAAAPLFAKDTSPDQLECKKSDANRASISFTLTHAAKASPGSAARFLTEKVALKDYAIRHCFGAGKGESTEASVSPALPVAPAFHWEKAARDAHGAPAGSFGFVKDPAKPDAACGSGVDCRGVWSQDAQSGSLLFDRKGMNGPCPPQVQRYARGLLEAYLRKRQPDARFGKFVATHDVCSERLFHKDGAPELEYDVTAVLDAELAPR